MNNYQQHRDVVFRVIKHTQPKGQQNPTPTKLSRWKLVPLKRYVLKDSDRGSV